MATATLPEPSKVRIEHECFIPATKQMIRDRLLEDLDRDGFEDRQLFLDFLRLIEAIYHFEYHALVEEIKEDYFRFEPGGAFSDLDGRTAEEIAAFEDRFLSNFLTIMDRGNFAPLSQEDVDLAEEEDYLFTLPIVIDWDGLDDEMLGRYFANHPYGNQGQAPGFAHRILIFRRGVGVDSTEGRFVIDKIEMLLRALCRRLWEKATGRGKGKGRDAGEESSPEPLGPQPVGAMESSKTHIHSTRYIERITLKNTLVSWANVFRKTAIQEPTFERLVILYRLATPPKRREKDPDPVKDRAIYIKTFRDIPMADLEVIFPEKKLSMNVVDRIKVAGTAVGGVAIVGFKFLLAAALSPVMLLTMAGGLAGYCGKTFLGYKRSKDRYQSLLTQSLYHKSMDNDKGVLFYLIDSLEAQEFKEAVLAYYFLWRRGDMTEMELDSTCETFLKNKFDLEIDFEVDDAIEKLRREGLVEEVENDKLHAVDIKEALRRLDYKWDNYFQYNLDD